MSPETRKSRVEGKVGGRFGEELEVIRGGVDTGISEQAHIPPKYLEVT